MSGTAAGNVRFIQSIRLRPRLARLLVVGEFDLGAINFFEETGRIGMSTARDQRVRDASLNPEPNRW
jgi:hypothetical protein